MAEPTADEGRDAPFLIVVVASLVALVVLVGGLTALGIAPTGPSDEEQVASVAADWLEAWAQGDAAAMVELTTAPADQVADALAAYHEAVGAWPETTPLVASVQGDQATMTFTVDVDVAGIGPWSYSARLALEDVEDEGWRVEWAASVLHPALGEDLRLVRATLPATPGTVLDALGQPLGGPLSTLVRNGVADRLDGTEGVELRAGLIVLRRRDPVPGEVVRTTLDPAVEAVAAAALDGVDRPAAVVVLQASTGAIRAAVSRPERGFPRALAGRYPPGSTFKIVTTNALLAAGTTTDQVVSCPPEAVVRGRAFRNAEGESLGDVPFRLAFAKSCNTAFVQLAAQLTPEVLLAAAERFGFNRDPDLGVPAGVPSFPAPGGLVDQVSAAIGQARVLATPLHMASVAGAVAAGGWRAPHLLVDRAAAPTPFGADPAVLQELMRLVVAEGTATRARVPGPVPVAGKTGTAEFGRDRPPRTHAWFIGFRGDVALAVLVEDTGFGGEVAAPIAAKVFRALD